MLHHTYKSLTRAQMSQCQTIWSLYQQVIEDLNRQRIFQWNETYPTHQYIHNSIKQEQCWIYQQNSQMIASVVLNRWQDPEWEKVSWHINLPDILIVHALVIHPHYQRQGIGKWMMQAIEAWAGDQGFQAIRLDAFSKNKASNLLYKNLGYQHCGSVDLSYKPINHRLYHCYEKAMIHEK